MITDTLNKKYHRNCVLCSRQRPNLETLIRGPPKYEGSLGKFVAMPIRGPALISGPPRILKSEFWAAFGFSSETGNIIISK